MHTDTARLDGVLEGLVPLCDAGRASYVQDLQNRLRAGALRVLFVGEAKRGKSTLINALLGRDLLPTGITPVTALSTTVRSGRPERTEVRMHDGRVLDVGLDEVADFVSEEHNPCNRRGVESVTAYVASPLPAEGLELVDTPGVGSVFEHNTEQARSALATMDAAVMVLTADPPVSATERSFLEQITKLSVHTFVVLNKVDRLDAAERSQAEDFTRRVLEDVGGEGPEVFACAARDGLAARSAGDPDGWGASGVEHFADALADYLLRRRSTDLRTSISTAAGRTARSLLDETVVGAAALDALRNQRSEQVVAFAERLEASRLHGQESLSVIDADIARKRSELDEDASDATGAVSAAAVAAVSRFVGQAAADAPVDLERQGRGVIAATIRERVDTWRGEWVEQLAQTAARLTDQQQNLLDQSLGDVRDAAATLLNIDLGTTMTPLGTPEVPTMHYDFDAPVGWNEPVAAALRHRAPLARRRVTAYLREQAVELSDKNVGRVRADLQRRLEALAHELKHNTAAAFDELAGGLDASVRSATALRDRTASDQDRERAMLKDREQHLRLVLAGLGAT